MDIEYIKKVLSQAEDIAYEGYMDAEVNSKNEMGYMCAQKVFGVLYSAIDQIGAPENKK